VVRLTVRIPEDLYQRLAAFADGRTFHRGDTQLADSVRDALAHYLTCPHKRRTRNGTVSSEDTREQTRNNTEDRSADTQPTYNGTASRVPLAPVTIPPQPVLDYDPHKYKLGSPCKAAGHLSHGDKNLRGIMSGVCIACDVEKKAAKAAPPAPLATADLDAMPVEPDTAPVDISQQPAPPVPAVSPRGVAVWDKAAVLTQLDAWKQAGLSLQAMADRLNTSKVPTFSGKGDWQKGTIGKLLVGRPAPVAKEA
jgi:hypothetical protein